MLDTTSSMVDSKDSETDADAGVNERIARRVRDLRTARGYTLDALTARSGVSRSMISLIERAAASPTAVVLEKLASGLGVPLASLFGGEEKDEPVQPLVRRAQQHRQDIAKGQQAEGGRKGQEQAVARATPELQEEQARDQEARAQGAGDHAFGRSDREAHSSTSQMKP